VQAFLDAFIASLFMSDLTIVNSVKNGREDLHPSWLEQMFAKRDDL
jgi:hypothetical protein